MKPHLLTILLFSFFTAQAQMNIKTFHNDLVKLNDTLYANRFEVSNAQYREFLNDLKKNDQLKKCASASIDSLQWGSMNEPYIVHYHAHEAYGDYPVVNITRDGAALYCEWLTEQYNQHPKRKFDKIIVRLPATHEWETAARWGNEDSLYPWPGDEVYTAEGAPMANFFHVDGDHTLAGAMTGNADITAPVKSYHSNELGLYNVAGNVAEMVSDRAVIKGGSWINGPEHLRIDHEAKYMGEPMIHVGFRYFVEVIEE